MANLEDVPIREDVLKCFVATCSKDEANVSFARVSTMHGSGVACRAHSMEHEVIPRNASNGSNGTRISGLD